MYHIYFIRYLHYLVELFIATYIFIFPKKFDLYYSIFNFILCFHWIIFKNECILSYLEKKFINPNYVLGSHPKKHIHRNVLTFSFYYNYLVNILYFVNILFVFYRNKSILIRSLLFLSLIITLYYRIIFVDTKEKLGN